MTPYDPENARIPGQLTPWRPPTHELPPEPFALTAAEQAELDWLASDEFWELLTAQLDRITAEVWGVTSDDGQ